MQSLYIGNCPAELITASNHRRLYAHDSRILGTALIHPSRVWSVFRSGWLSRHLLRVVYIPSPLPYFAFDYAETRAVNDGLC